MKFYKRLEKVQSYTPRCTYRVDWGVASIPRFIEQYNIDMDPDYQRDYIWTVDQKKAFVGAVIQNHNTIPIFWFNSEGPLENRNKVEVVDGKQRINAILGWLDNKYEAICPCGEVFWYKDIDEIGRRILGMATTLKMHFVQLSRKDVLKFYLALNSGGTIHNEKDLSKVRKMLEEEI